MLESSRAIGIVGKHVYNLGQEVFMGGMGGGMGGGRGGMGGGM